MASRPLKPLSADQALAFKLDKLRQILIASEFCLLIVVIQRLLLGSWQTALILAMLALILGICYYVAKYGRLQVGAALFLTSLTITTSYFMWFYGGLNDEALLVFPAILIFSAVIASYGLLVLLLLYMLATVMLLGYVNEAGLYSNEVPSGDLNSAFLTCAILVMVAFSVWLLSRDLRNLLEKLSRENLRVMESKDEISRLYNHDPLTNLPNRRLAKELFEQSVALAQRHNSKSALIFLDLDHFKAVNDSLGHATGDEFLKKVAQRLQSVLRDSDTICRFGGDEFVILSQNFIGDGQIHQLAQRILQGISRPFYINGNELVVSGSMGIALAPNDGVSFDDLCQKADTAMYSCKDKGRNNYCFYDQDMNQSEQKVLQLTQELRQALSGDKLCLHYQPKVELKTGNIVGAEALVRWQHPERGWISPVEFIPLAERAGLIVELGQWVLESAVSQCKRWHELGYKHLSVSVNVSAIQLRRGDFELQVRQVLNKADLSGEFLVLELTESLLLDVQPSLQMCLQGLREQGVILAIDDFGTGYCNLGYLQRFDVNMLKIDRSFISKISESKQDEAIVRAIIQMAQSLNLEIVAEGVETAKVAEQLSQLGCEKGQGFYWSRPCPPMDFIELVLNKQSIPSATPS